MVGGFVHEVRVPRFNELFEVSGEYKLLDDATQCAQGCCGFDPVNHGGDLTLLTELVNMPESVERTLDLSNNSLLGKRALVVHSK